MTAEVLMHLEFSGIQSFVFRTGRLLDTVGRSALIESLTDPEEEPLQALLRKAPLVRVLERLAGAFTIAAPSEEAAREFVAAYSRATIDASDSVRLTAAVGGIEHDPVAALRLAKRTAYASSAGYPLAGATRCALTGLAAEVVERDPDGNRAPVAAEVRAARERGRSRHVLFEKHFSERSADSVVPENVTLTLPMEVDSAAPERGISSKIAMVVADINGLGDRLEKLRAESVDGLAVVSGLLRQLNTELLEHLLMECATRTEFGEDVVMTGEPVELRFPLVAQRTARKDSQTQVRLPIRPIIAGGDDLVFVCESRLAWSLCDAAIRYLSQPPDGSAAAKLRDHESRQFEDGGRLSLTLGFGIAIVPSGYSLARAHEFASRECKSAKSWRRTNSYGGHVLAWQFGTVEREAPAGDGLAGPREPYCLDLHGGASTSSRRPWDWLMGILDPGTGGGIRNHPSSAGETASWSRKRSWVKGELRRELLTIDPTADVLNVVKAATHAEGVQLPEEFLSAQLDHRSVLLDAIELLDEHLTWPIRTADQGLVGS